MFKATDSNGVQTWRHEYFGLPPGFFLAVRWTRDYTRNAEDDWFDEKILTRDKPDHDNFAILPGYSKGDRPIFMDYNALDRSHGTSPEDREHHVAMRRHAYDMIIGSTACYDVEAWVEGPAGFKSDPETLGMTCEDWGGPSTMIPLVGSEMSIPSPSDVREAFDLHVEALRKTYETALREADRLAFWP